MGFKRLMLTEEDYGSYQGIITKSTVTILLIIVFSVFSLQTIVVILNLVTIIL